MPFDPLSPPVESLVAESADIATIADYFGRELGDVLDNEQLNASVITRLTQLRDVALVVANAFS